MCEWEGITFKILSWNINGIRTFKNLKQTLDELEADVICLQETKITRDMVDEPTAVVEGYNAYFSFSRTRSGYSGVATYCKDRATPFSAEEGLSGILQVLMQPDIVGCLDDIETEFTPQELKRLDSEGRAVITQHQLKKPDGSSSVVTIFNVYCPRADPERPERLDFKLRFNRLLELRARALKQSGSLVMVVGDINISHLPIDRCENVDLVEFEANPARQWLNSFLMDTKQMKKKDSGISKDNSSFKMIDSFRYFHQDVENVFTCWNTKINARSTNFGSRIDYIFVDSDLIENMIDSLVLSDIQGSDHCPVSGIFSFEPLKSLKCPSACIKNFPEFCGIQQKVSAFFVKKLDVPSDTPEEVCKPLSSVSCQSQKRRYTENTGKEYCGMVTLKKSKLKRNSNQKQISSFFQITQTAAEEVIMSSSQGSASSASDGSGLESGNMQERNIETERLEKSVTAASVWRSMLTGPRPPPLCKGHKEPCVERTVKKKGPNFNRKFFACARGEGSKTDPRARCDHFEWAVKK